MAKARQNGPPAGRPKAESNIAVAILDKVDLAIGRAAREAFVIAARQLAFDSPALAIAGDRADFVNTSAVTCSGRGTSLNRTAHIVDSVAPISFLRRAWLAIRIIFGGVAISVA